MPLALPILAAFLLDRRTWIFMLITTALFFYIGGAEIVYGVASGQWWPVLLGLCGVSWFTWKAFKGGKR